MSTKSPSETAVRDGSHDDFENSIAVLEPAQIEVVGPCCEHCGAPQPVGKVAICRSCGWYASLGRCVEVDPHWEADDPTVVTTPTAEPGPESHFGVWLRLLPPWAWLMIASVLAVVMESFVVRLVTPDETGGIRTTWSVLQLFVGLAVFVGCHVFNFLQQVADDSDVGVIDIVLRPIKLWLRAMRHLPAKLWLVDAAACGVTAAAMSVFVIGALPYDRLWDWGFKAPAKQNLMGAVMDRAKQLNSGKGADNLEDAVNDFAGKAEVDNHELPKAPPPKPRERADCVILGFEVDRDGRLQRLILGTSFNKKLVFAGTVEPQVDESERRKLLTELLRIKVSAPFIPLQSDSATWVKAKYACRVTYGERLRGGQLRDVQWDTMLGAIRGQ